MLFFIAQMEPNAIDIVNKVESFYQSSFTMLVAVLTIGLVIVGIVIPLVINRFQIRSFDRAEKRLRDEIKELESKVAVGIHKSAGDTFFMQAGGFFKVQTYEMALCSSLKAIEMYARANDLTFLNSALEMAENTVEKVEGGNKFLALFKSLFNLAKKACEEENLRDQYTNRLDEIRNKISCKKGQGD